MKIGCMAGVEYKGKIIFVSTYVNGLFELDTENKNVRLIAVLEKERNERALFRRALIFKNEAWFIPQKGEHIICVNLDTYDMTYYSMNYTKKYQVSSEYPYFYSYIDAKIIDDDILVCIPSGLDAIQLINLNSHKFDYIEDVSQPTKDRIHSVFIFDGKLNVLSEKGILDVLINLETKEKVKANWKLTEYHFLSSVEKGDDLYLLPTVNESNTMYLGRINMKTGKTEFYDIPWQENGYYSGFSCGDNVICFPDYTKNKNIIRYCVSGKKFCEVKYPEEVVNKIKGENVSVRCIDSKSGFYATLMYNDLIVEFNTEGEIINCFDIGSVVEEDSKRIIENSKKNGIYNGILSDELLSEGEPFYLKDFLMII